MHSSIYKKLDKNIEIGNNERHGAPFGEIEINNLAIQSWKKILTFVPYKIKKIIWPELSKQCYNLSCTMCRMNFLSNILT
jgi:hypothetical protein